jgi:hypothetical protein
MPGFTGLFATIIGAIAAGNIALIALGLAGVVSRDSAGAAARPTVRESLA